MSGRHVFAESLARGRGYEDIVARALAPGVREASFAEQRLGVDLVTSGGVAVEVKADYMTSKTGNVALEVYSVLEAGTLGWTATSTADLLVYFIVGEDGAPLRVHLALMSCVRDGMTRWIRRYPLKLVGNSGYHSVICPVPETVFAKITRCVEVGCG